MRSKIFFLIVFFFPLNLFPQSVIEKVEPPNWWVGMKLNEIEILVYGKNISSYKPSLEYDGARLIEVKTSRSKNYLFLTLSISKECSPGLLPIKFISRNGKSFTYQYPLLRRELNRANIKGFNSSDVVYLITPDRFVNGDESNDNIEGMKDKADRTKEYGRHGGDIKGITNRLNYIKNLGMTSIWINPLLENNMKDWSYHGYAITDFYKIDPRFGSNASYKDLCEKAKAKGLKIIMDMVVNHCGLNHPWLKDLPMESWINTWKTYTETNHRKTVSIDPYASKFDKNQFIRGWFVPSMPDLNQENSSVSKYLIQNAIWWIEYAGINGIRMDTYPYSDEKFLSEWTKAIMTEYPNFNIVGEQWSLIHGFIAYWQKGKKNPNGYKSHLNTLMDFPLQQAIVEALNQSSTWESSWVKVYQSLSQDFMYPNPHNLMIFLDNHDMSRIFTQLKENFYHYKLAMTMLLTMRGIPKIYYGTEILMSHPGKDSHGIIRSDFPGGWKGDKINVFKQRGLTQEQIKAYRFLKKILSWRKNKAVIHTGKLMHFAPKKNAPYVYFRYNKNKKVMVILNKNEKEIQLDLSPYKEMIQNSKKAVDIITGKTFSLTKKLKVLGKSPMILELK